MEKQPRTEYTRQLCRWIVGLSAADMAPEVTEEVRRRTLDWLGCSIGALGSPAAAGLKDLSDQLGGAQQCTLLGGFQKTSLLNGVFFNAAVGHILEYDDVNKVSISHPGAAVIPAALAVSEKQGLPFGRYAAAVAAGYEVVVRLGTVLNPSLYNHWHTTSVCGAFAAAAVAGKLLGYAPEELERGLSITAMMASGLVYGFGTDAKLVNVGHAAAAGVLGALLARKGFSAPERVLEDEKGFAAAVSQSRDFQGLLPQPGDDLKILDCHYKIHASCGHTHSALDAFLSLQREYGFPPQEIRSIEVFAYAKAVELVGPLRCSTEAQAKFSLPYCLAAAAVCGQASLEAFRQDRREDARVLELARRVTVTEDPAFTGWYPAKRAERVRVILDSGLVLERTYELPEGKHPSLDDIKRKFLGLCERTVSAERAQRICQRVLGLREQSDMRELMSYIREDASLGK